MKKIIIVIGPPGSGKGTQAKKIAEKYKYKHLSTGDLLRQLEKSVSHTGEEQKALQIMRIGKLVPDELIYKLVFKEIEKHLSKGQGVILDGAIRSEKQAKEFDSFFKKNNYLPEVQVLDITLSDKETFNRLAQRRVCSQCGEIIPAAYTSDACPKCKGKLARRSDDDKQTIQERVVLQGNKALQPIRDWYTKQKTIQTINGEQAIAAVEKDIVDVLENAYAR